ncbi:MAG: hypothetical protein KJ063_23850 [Anaerolineae bacterium]|nr:hypothetical protein [Anaerolineae bacterium]
MSEEWITTNEAAELSGYHPDYIRKLLLANRVNGRKFGPTWQVDKQDFLDYLKRMDQQGEKRGPKTD